MVNYPRDSYAFREMQRRKAEEARRGKEKVIDLVSKILLVAVFEAFLVVVLFM